MRPHLGWALALSLAASFVACRHRHDGDAMLLTDPSISYGLGASDPDARKDAAKKLRDDDGPPKEAVPHLIKAIEREKDGDAMEEMLITLGASGAPEAKPVLEAHLNDNEKDARKGAEKGLERWSKRTGQALSSDAPKIARLENADWKVRRDAADDLDGRHGPPPDAVGPLLAAAKKEQNAEALSAMMLALGSAGPPEAQPIIEAHLADPNGDVRRAANKAMKRWRGKNGQNVRQDIGMSSQPGAPPQAGTTPGGAGTQPALPDGCSQFKDICAADPFNLDKCKGDMKALSYAQQQSWADCVNASNLPCQKAHDTCVAKVKK